MPQLPLVAFAHMSGHLIRQFGQDPFSKWSVSLTANLELRTTRDTQLWGFDRAFEKTPKMARMGPGCRHPVSLRATRVCVLVSQQGLLLQGEQPTPRGQLAQLSSGTRREKLYPICPGYLLPKKLHFWAGGRGNSLCSLHGHQSAKAPQALGDKNSWSHKVALVRCCLRVEIWEELIEGLQSLRRICGQKST